MSRPLHLVALVIFLSAIAGHASGAEVDAASVKKYLLRHEKPNGGFGPIDQEHTDLAWNYPAVHALVLLGEKIPRPEEAFQNGRGAAYLEEGSHQKIWSWDIYQRSMLALALGRDPGPEYDLGNKWQLEYVDRAGWYYPRINPGKLKARTAQFNEISSLWHFVGAITRAGGTIENSNAAKDYLLPRQCSNGAFEDSYRAETQRDESAAHLVATAEAVLTLRALGADVPGKEKCIQWIRSCQTTDGGFRWNPTSPAHSNKPDIWYTWYAVLALKELGAKPADPEGCVTWINTLQNADGGFGDRPGWVSRLYSTYYAVDALQSLTGNASKAIRKKAVPSPSHGIAEGAYSIFQAHLKSPTGGADMVEAARTMGFNFLGVKTNTPDGPNVPVEEAIEHARAKDYAMELAVNPENYAHKLEWHGGIPAHHVSNWIMPPELSQDQRKRFEAADQAGRRGLPWVRYKEEVIAPTLEIGTLFYPEMDYTMINAYMVYDDGLDRQPGYNAVIAALGWTPWDWIRMFPYRERWIGQLPMVADGDAHGDIEKWAERLDRQRILYIAKSHKLGDFLEACSNARTVCVIRAGADRSRIVYYGSPAAVAYVKKHMGEWKWW